MQSVLPQAILQNLAGRFNWLLKCNRPTSHHKVVGNWNPTVSVLSRHSGTIHKRGRLKWCPSSERMDSLLLLSAQYNEHEVLSACTSGGC